MTDFDQAPFNSPLSQLVTRDGKTVQVEIYDDGEGGWLLEVVDEHGNSIVWDASFKSDYDALAEAFKAIDEDGIDSLIGSPSDRQEGMELDPFLSDAEVDELDDFFGGNAIEETSMDVSSMDGFLTAIAIGPEFVRPSEWLPWVWDREEGEAQPEFEGDEQANRIISLVMQHYNAVVHAFNTDPASFRPMFRRGDQWSAAEWCEGFMLGFQFNAAAWSLLLVGQPSWLKPFLRLGSDEGLEITLRAGDAEKWMNEIEPSLVKIHAYWEEKRGSQPSSEFEDGFTRRERKEGGTLVRDGPKIGRNDPCPCGSGKKFKKCCGAGGTPPLLH